MKYCFQCFLLVILGVLITACHQKQSVRGSVNGNFVYLDSPVDGKLVNVACKARCSVKAGEPLFSISLQDPQESYDHLMVNKIHLKEHLLTLQKYAERSHLFYERDSIYYELKILEAMLSAEKDDLRTITIKAPADAWVYNVYYNVDDYVVQDIPVMSVLPKKSLFIVFYLDSENYSKLHVGDVVTVQSDFKTFKARVVYNAVAGQFVGEPHHRRYQYHAVPINTDVSALLPGTQVTVSF